MYRRTPLKKPESLGRILQKALKRRKVPIDLEEKRMISLWDKAVGPQISAQTQPSHIKGKKLFVKVSTSVWMQQLHFLKADIIKQFNSLAQKEAVRNIFFSIGRIDRLPVSSTEPSLPLVSFVLKKRDQKMIDDCTGFLADKELREIVKRVMIKELMHRRMTESGKDR